MHAGGWLPEGYAQAYAPLRLSEKAVGWFVPTEARAGLGCRACHVGAARVGNSIWNVEPFPSVDSTQMRPPCISTISLAMASPRPVPPLALVLELSTWWNWSPVSVNLMALPTMLSST